MLAHVKGWAVGLLAATALLAGCGSSAKQASTTAPAAHGAPETPANGLHGLVPTPLPAKPQFTLIDTAGKPYDFDARTAGKLTYLFFGYTHCPDACPATMSSLAYALRTQPAAVRKQVDVVFVSVDPRRDTGPVIRTWLDHYNRAFVGIRGSVQQIGVLEHEAGVPTAVAVRHKGTVSYEVEHSSILFVYSPDDRAHVVYAQGFKASDYAHDLPLLLKYR
jgi:protein SCO1/2